MWPPSFSRVPTDNVWEARSLPARSTKFYKRNNICSCSFYFEVYNKKNQKKILKTVVIHTKYPYHSSCESTCIVEPCEFTGRAFNCLKKISRYIIDHYLIKLHVSLVKLWVEYQSNNLMRSRAHLIHWRLSNFSLSYKHTIPNTISIRGENLKISTQVMFL